MSTGFRPPGTPSWPIALAGSIFFNVSVRAAQSRVALSLALTVAPFAIVGPLLGPLVERARGGKRAIVMLSAGGRAVCCFFMAYWAHSLVLFPVAFFTLVFSKLYMVTRAALVPGVVDRPEQLVLANSKLAVGGSAAGMAAGGVGAALLSLFDSPWVLRFDIVVYLACAWGATRLLGRPPAHRSPAPPTGLGPAPYGTRAGPDRCRCPWPRSWATAGRASNSRPWPRRACGPLRDLSRSSSSSPSGATRPPSSGTGWRWAQARSATWPGPCWPPRFRRRAAEEWMLTASSVVVGAAALSAGLISWGRHWTVAVFLAAGIGLAAGSGKLAFDSMVQRDVPSRVRGRSFARFESGFQLAWAIGGLLAVLVPMTLSTGFITIGGIGLFGALAFARGSVSARRGTLPTWWPGSAPRPPPSSPSRTPVPTTFVDEARGPPTRATSVRRR